MANSIFADIIGITEDWGHFFDQGMIGWPGRVIRGCLRAVPMRRKASTSGCENIVIIG